MVVACVDLEKPMTVWEEISCGKYYRKTQEKVVSQLLFIHVMYSIYTLDMCTIYCSAYLYYILQYVCVLYAAVSMCTVVPIKYSCCNSCWHVPPSFQLQYRMAERQNSCVAPPSPVQSTTSRRPGGRSAYICARKSKQLVAREVGLVSADAVQGQGVVW